jgi:hypothetical protein
MVKRIVALILCLLMTIPVFVSCADKTALETPDETTASAQTEVIDPRDIPDGLPERDYNKETFTLFCREEAKAQYFTDSENGEIVNDAVYARNLAVEERFNITLDYFTMDGTWANMVAYKNAIKSAIQAGDDSYDLIEGNCAIADLLGNGYFLNWNAMEFMDFSQPWWAQSSQRELNIGGNLEFIVGDYTLMLWEGLLVIYFNKQLATDLNIENPYDIVNNGKWTIDKLAEISREITQDLNGDSKFDNNDLYGLITTTGNCIDNFWISSDMPITVMDEDNFPILNLPIQLDRALSVSEKVFNLVTGTGVYAIDENKLTDTLQPMFMADQGLFFTDFLDSSEVYRTMETDFGIIPYPKYDENQEKYETFSKTGYGSFAIPSVVSDPEMSAVITTALNAESYKVVVPAYYDVALKTKYSRDDESAKMLDIIRNGFDMDFACVCLDYTSWVLLEMRNMVQAKNFDMASRIAKLENKINTSLEKLKTDILSRQ